MTVYRHTFHKAVRLRSTLAAVLAVLSTSMAFAVELPKNKFNVSYNTFSHDDGSYASTLLLGRKQLKEDVSSLKFRYQMNQIEDKSTNQISTASAYSETHNILGAGIDYVYFDSVMSFSSSYATMDSTGKTDLNFDLVQEYNNGSRAFILGFSHDWINDSDVDIKQTRQGFRLGNKNAFTQTWVGFTRFEFVLSDGDLENDFNKRRFNNNSSIDDMNLPNSKAEQSLSFLSINERSPTSQLTSEYKLGRNNWKQNSLTLRFALERIHSERFSMTYHGRYFTQDESTYFTTNIVADPDADQFQSNDVLQAKINTTEFGLMGTWSFKQTDKQRFDNLKINFGYTNISNKYSTTPSQSNNGSLIQLNLSGFY